MTNVDITAWEKIVTAALSSDAAAAEDVIAYLGARLRAYGGSFKVPIAIIAEDSGTSREVVSRILIGLERRGYLAIVREGRLNRLPDAGAESRLRAC
jgi:CRP-like cAMP-binding protein